MQGIQPCVRQQEPLLASAQRLARGSALAMFLGVGPAVRLWCWSGIDALARSAAAEPGAPVAWVVAGIALGGIDQSRGLWLVAGAGGFYTSVADSFVELALAVEALGALREEQPGPPGSGRSA